MIGPATAGTSEPNPSTPWADSAEDGPLATVDELARLTMRYASPISFEIATSAEAIDSAYRLRYDAIAKHGWSGPGALRDGREWDEYDESAIHVLAMDGPRTVGGTRIVFPKGDRLLPTEAAFDLRFDDATVVDHGRTVVSRASRDRGHRIFMGLLFRTWMEIRRCGYSRLCGTATESVWRMSGRLGIVLDAVGPGRPYWGAVRYPYIWAPEHSYAALQQKWRPRIDPP